MGLFAHLFPPQIAELSLFLCARWTKTGYSWTSRAPHTNRRRVQVAFIKRRRHFVVSLFSHEPDCYELCVTDDHRNPPHAEDFVMTVASTFAKIHRIRSEAKPKQILVLQSHHPKCHNYTQRRPWKGLLFLLDR